MGWTSLAAQDGNQTEAQRSAPTRDVNRDICGVRGYVRGRHKANHAPSPP